LHEGSHLCGILTWKDRFVDLKTTFDHTGRSLVLNFSSTIN